MPLNRTIPASGLASEQKWFERMFDATQRVAVYWPLGPDSVTLVGYRDTISAAKTLRDASVNAAGAKPFIAINWWHSTITRVSVGANSHPDSRVALPDWIDEDL